MRDIHQFLPAYAPERLPRLFSPQEMAKTGDNRFGYLLGVGVDPKTEKSNAKGQYRTAIMYLQPGREACKWASKGCLKGCLHTAGNPVYLKGKKKARGNRMHLFVNDPYAFMARLIEEITKFRDKCLRDGVLPAVRLNGTSDIPWERVAPWLFTMFGDVQFYDYTKGYDRLGNTPDNYWLTMSRSEENEVSVGLALARGFHVAVVAIERTAKSWNGYGTEDGDADDLLFLRDNPVQVLKPKGKARKDTSGFVLHQLGV